MGRPQARRLSSPWPSASSSPCSFTGSIQAFRPPQVIFRLRCLRHVSLPVHPTPPRPRQRPPLETVSDNFGSASYAGEQASLRTADGLCKGYFSEYRSDPDRLKRRRRRSSAARKPLPHLRKDRGPERVPASSSDPAPYGLGKKPCRAFCHRPEGRKRGDYRQSQRPRTACPHHQPVETSWEIHTRASASPRRPLTLSTFCDANDRNCRRDRAVIRRQHEPREGSGRPSGRRPANIIAAV